MQHFNQNILFILLSSFLTASCGFHESENFGFSDSGPSNKVEKPTEKLEMAQYNIETDNLSDFQKQIAEGLDLNTTLPNGRTLLTQSVYSYRVQFVSYLVKAGCQVDLKDQFGKFAKDYAQDKPEILRLFEPVNPEEQDRLVLLVQNDDYEAILELLDSGMNPNFLNAEGQSPLILAIELGFELSFRTLLRSDQIDINFRNQSNLTPLSVARSLGRKKMENLLIERGAHE